MSPFRHGNLRVPAVTGYRGTLSTEFEVTVADRITVDPAVTGGPSAICGRPWL